MCHLGHHASTFQSERSTVQFRVTNLKVQNLHLSYYTYPSLELQT